MTTELFLGFSDVAGVFDNTAVRINTEGPDPDVDDDLFIRGWEPFLWHVVAREGYKPFTAWRSANGDGLDVALDRPRKRQIEPSDAGNCKIAAIKLPAGLLQGKRIVPAVFLLIRTS